jgi:putative lipoprotein
MVSVVSRRRGPLPVVGLVVACLLGPAAARAREDDWLGPDKALHFGTSFALAGAGYAAGAAFSERPAVRLGVGAGVAMSAGIAKEVLDRHTGGDPSWKDLGWDAAGTATGLLTAWLIDRYLLSGSRR